MTIQRYNCVHCGVPVKKQFDLRCPYCEKKNPFGRQTTLGAYDV